MNTRMQKKYRREKKKKPNVSTNELPDSHYEDEKKVENFLMRMRQQK